MFLLKNDPLVFQLWMMQTIIKTHLNFHPYKIMIVQKSLPNSTVQRRHFCEVLLDDLAVIITSDEAHFHLNG